MIPILAEVGGRVRFEDIIEGETLRTERDPGGSERRMIMEHKGDLHPQVIVEDQSGKILDFYYIPEKAHIEVVEGQQISAGTMVGKTPREVSGKPCRFTCSAKSRASIAARASISTTSTSRLSCLKCCARFASTRAAIPRSCPAR